MGAHHAGKQISPGANPECHYARGHCHVVPSDVCSSAANGDFLPPPADSEKSMNRKRSGVYSRIIRIMMRVFSFAISDLRSLAWN